MVKQALFAVLLLCSLLAADPKEEVESKVRSLIGEDAYLQNKAFIELIFSPAEKFIHNDRVDAVAVIDTLKENGLLKLFFKKPLPIELSFITNGSPLFFVKLIGDTLRDIGYYRFVTQSATYNSSEFVWSVRIVSEYVTDPMLLRQHLAKKGCEIIDISRKSDTRWAYTIDMSSAHLTVQTLQEGSETILKRSLLPFWLDISKIRRLRIISKGRNRWYPDIAYYDANLHLVKVIQRDKRSYDITLIIPKNAKYIKIADLYTMKNIKDPLVLKPSGTR